MFYVFGLFSNFDFEYNDEIAHFTALCNFLVEIDFSNSDGSDFLRDLLGQRSMMRERDLSGPAEQNGLNGPRLTLPHIIFNILFVTSIYQFTNPQILLSKNY